MGFFGGIGRVIKSPLTYHKANKIIKQAKERYASAEEDLEDARARLQGVIERVGEKKLDFSANLLQEVQEKLSAVRKNLNFSQNKVAQEEEIYFEEQTLPVVQKVATSAKEVIGAGFVMGSTSYAAYAGAIGIATKFGLASTGTAISSLSGAAATNATLAWFGGGAVGASGAGMAGGAVVLGGIALAPILVIGSIKFASHAEKKMTAAQEFSAKVDIAVEQINAMIETICVLDKHFVQFENTLDNIAKRLKQALRLLGKAHQQSSEQESMERAFFACVLLTKTLKRLLEVNLLTEEGVANAESMRVIEHATCSQHESPTNNQVVDAVVTNQKITKPKGVHKIAEIAPGRDSNLYFWLHDVKGSFNWKGFLSGIVIAYAIAHLIKSIFF